MLALLKKIIPSLREPLYLNFPYIDLRTIDQLWAQYFNGRFGFSVQKRIWESVGGHLDAEKDTIWQFAEAMG